MDKLTDELADYLISRLSKIDSSSRLLVGISGIPGSGKSTLAKLVVNKVNDKSPGSTLRSSRPAILVGLDGWHLSRAQLDAFPNPKLAHDRRGAHWTFDGSGYASFSQSLRESVTSGALTHGVITAPAFDHARKDPEPDAIAVLPHHRLIIIEGLYTFLSIDPWVKAGTMLDERWFIDIDTDEAMKRLVKRHVVTGVAKDTEEAIWRTETNDAPNSLFIIRTMLEPTRRIPNPDDPTFRDAVEHEAE